MSGVSAIKNHQQESAIVNDIHTLLGGQACENIQQKIKKLSLINLYSIYQNLSKIERKQLLEYLPSTPKLDLIRLTAESDPVIELINTEQLLVVQENSTVGMVKSKRLNQQYVDNSNPIVVVNEFNQYLGIIELHHLIACPDDTLASEIVAESNKLHVSETQRNAANIIANSGTHFAVLVDNQNSVVGLLSLTDIIKNKAQQETQTDNRPYLQIPVLSHVRQRIFWILALAAVGLLSGIIIQSYDDAITALIILAFYMPMVADTGGNAGSQAATVIIRSIALGELKLKNWFAILYKEIRIALFIGLGLACVSFLKITFLSYGIDLPEGLTLTVIAFAIALAIFIQVLSATLIGASLPLIVKWFKQDPAVVASPAITTVVDVTGLLIYFYITSSFLLY
ncbi:magnesium transporter MgtE [Psychromonas marina]|uniref:Magnesium transporter MgtE n=1 Tax=Psychromonas marina TaxID=88364 RepID=A0ABQ6E4C7_9GAMM|nr:magnesium transporter [Psychromonas marina]GLS92025.1 magnesium transporter MgtE [Psychromonas marina]